MGGAEARDHARACSPSRYAAVTAAGNGTAISLAARSAPRARGACTRPPGRKLLNTAFFIVSLQKDTLRTNNNAGRTWRPSSMLCANLEQPAHRRLPWPGISACEVHCTARRRTERRPRAGSAMPTVLSLSRAAPLGLAMKASVTFPGLGRSCVAAATTTYFRIVSEQRPAALRRSVCSRARPAQHGIDAVNGSEEISVVR
jgi:hypothetical protein